MNLITLAALLSSILTRDRECCLQSDSIQVWSASGVTAAMFTNHGTDEHNIRRVISYAVTKACTLDDPPAKIAAIGGCGPDPLATVILDKSLFSKKFSAEIAVAVVEGFGAATALQLKRS